MNKCRIKGLLRSCFIFIAVSFMVAESAYCKAESDLILWYTFENDFVETGIVKDLSGQGYDAAVIGHVAAADGVIGNKAISFDNQGYIQAVSNPVAGKKNISFSYWFKTNNPKSNYKMASAAWWNSGPASGWIMATHIPEFWSDDTHSLYLSDITNVENNFPAAEWIYEVVTYDGRRIKEYTNDGQS